MGDVCRPCIYSVPIMMRNVAIATGASWGCRRMHVGDSGAAEPHHAL